MSEDINKYEKMVYIIKFVDRVDETIEALFDLSEKIKSQKIKDLKIDEVYEIYKDFENKYLNKKIE